GQLMTHVGREARAAGTPLRRRPVGRGQGATILRRRRPPGWRDGLPILQAMQPCNLPLCLQIGIDPVALRLGPLALYWYGLLVAAGFILAIWVASQEARRQGLDPDQLLSAALVGALVGLLFARVFY